MQNESYHNVRETKLAHLTELSRSDLLAFARTCTRRTRLKLLAVGAVLLTGCAGMAPVPEPANALLVVPHTTITAARATALADLETRGKVVDITDSSLTVEKELEGGQAILAQLAMGNAYSSTPVGRLKLTYVQMGDDVKVYGNAWVQTQMPTGAINKTDAKNSEVQKILVRIYQP
jgi:hypothetical protein